MPRGLRTGASSCRTVFAIFSGVATTIRSCSSEASCQIGEIGEAFEPAGRIRDGHVVALRGQEFDEPASHLARAADHERRRAAAASAGGDANAAPGSSGDPRISRRITDSARSGESCSDSAVSRARSSTSRSR